MHRIWISTEKLLEKKWSNIQFGFDIQPIQIQINSDLNLEIVLRKNWRRQIRLFILRENKRKTMNFTDDSAFLQKLEEKARKAEEALEAEQKVRKELEGLNSKLLAEKTALLDSLAGEKGSLQEYQEKAAKLQAQKNDLDNQLRVSILDLGKE